MKPINLFLLVTFLATNLAHATTFYRHIPFTVSIKDQDNIIVNYDFSQKRGIRCLGDNNLKIDFVYKGHKKSAHLPVVLQSDHVPKNGDEELADINGQFEITITSPFPKAYKLLCDYS